MPIWEIDFYRRPLQDEQGNELWELLVCNPEGTLQQVVNCPQSQVNADWVAAQLQHWLEAGCDRPDVIRVFRPQTLHLLEPACERLGISVEPTRRTPTLKRWLVERSQLYPTFPGYNHQPYQPLHLDQPPPVPLSENLWGDRWRFATLPAGELIDFGTGYPIPILEMPEFLLPLNLGLASTAAIPGIVIDGGRRSLPLAQWLQQAQPIALNYVPGAPDGLILEAGLVDRWVVATFEDADVKAAAQLFEQRKQASQGLHFLLVQPDDSGMTYTGFWLLKAEG
ncbi:Tab2/Atab2 family RNA-binding protein [Pantanalinema rosaneae CENA516]|uniref:Tab2/Atab2 family RNA-binding protein n=1 Tax=Pantanalinema rosaneae TaxID=1620701 RepID=UPI003D6FD4E4